MSTLPSSVLTKVVKELPDNWKMTTSGIENFLQKKGVKPEELEFSGVKEELNYFKDNPEYSQLGKEDLVWLERSRADKFSNRETAGYEGVTLPGTRTNYKVNIRKFSDSDALRPREVRSHFSDGDYLFHSRTTDNEIDGHSTLLVQEIQSDLHQRGRQYGYTKGDTGSVPERSPFAKNWYRKALEQELLNAAESGKQALAVPLEGAKPHLARAQGVQKWYETQVRSTLKKLAKQIGGEYQETSILKQQLDLPYDGHSVTYKLNEDPVLLQDARVWVKEYYSLDGLATVSGVGQDVIDAALNKNSPGDLAVLLSNLDTLEMPEELKRRFYKPEPWKPGNKESITEALHEDDELLDEILEEAQFFLSKRELEELHEAYDSIDAVDILAERLQHFTREELEEIFDFSWYGVIPDQSGVTLGKIVFPDADKIYRTNTTLEGDAVKERIPSRVLTKFENAPTNIKELDEMYEHIRKADGTPIDQGNWKIDEIERETADWKSQQFYGHTDNAHQFFEDLSDQDVINYLNSKGVWDNMKQSQSFPVQIPEYDTPAWTKKIQLYSAGGAGTALATNDVEASTDLGTAVAFGEGLNRTDVIELLQEAHGLTPEQAEIEVDRTLKEKIPELLADDIEPELIQELFGLTEEDYGKYFETSTEQVDLEEQGINAKLMPVNTDQQMINAHILSSTDELAAKANILYGTYKREFTGYKEALFEDTEAGRKYQAMTRDYAVSMANALRGLGRNIEIDPESLELIDADTGEYVDIGFIDSMYESQFEIAGGTAGAIGAYKFADHIAKYVPGGKLVKGLVKLGTTVLGSSGGAAVGKSFDTMRNAIYMKQQLDAEYYWNQLQDTGAYTAAAEVVGGAVLSGGITVIRGVYKGFKALMDGNRSGAYKELKAYLDLDDQQVNDIIKAWEDLTGNTAPGFRQSTKALHVLPQTQPGGEAIVSGAARLSPKTSSDLARSISARAKDINKMSSNLTNNNVGTVIKDELEKYTTSVKGYYTGVKNYATEATAESKYAFNYDKLAIDPMLDEMHKKITNPAVLQRFELYAERIRELGGKLTPKKLDQSPIYLPDSVKKELIKQDAPKLRTFTDLLDLRKTLNDFKYNTRIRSAVDYKVVNRVIKSVDEEIKRVAKTEMDDGDTWLKAWSQANTEYGKMKTLEKNVLYKALTAKGVTPDKVVKALSSKIGAVDGTFMSVIGKLQPRERQLAEGAVLDFLVKKHTIGFDSGLQATHFTNLTDELKHIPFTTSKAKELKRAIGEMSKVFKNDVNLSRATGQIAQPKFAHYLTTDPVVRAKYEIASHVFNYIKRLSPSESGDATALITHVAKVLKDPAEINTLNTVISKLKPDPELSAAIKQLAITYAKFGEPEKYPKVTVYRQGIPGQSYKVKDGPFGRGMYWSTSKDKLAGKIIEEDVLPGRIALPEDVQQLLGDTPFKPEYLKEKGLVEKLKDLGYEGFSMGEDIIIFKE